MKEHALKIIRLYEQLKAKRQATGWKDEQMRVKDAKSQKKDKRVDQQQQLTLQAQWRIKETLQLELDQAKQVQASKGFFARLFGK